MTQLAAFLTLLVCASALADESFRARDGVEWAVRADARESGGNHESRTLHVLRASKEVARFEESSSSQHNPTMRQSTSWSFRLDGDALTASETSVKSKTVVDERGRHRKTTDRTVTDYTWNGSAFVAGKPKVTREETREP